MASCGAWMRVESAATSRNGACGARVSIRYDSSIRGGIMRTKSCAGSIVLLVALCACGGQDGASRAEPPVIEETAFGEVVGTMDKARAVEDVTRQRTEQLNEALENEQDR